MRGVTTKAIVIASLVAGTLGVTATSDALSKAHTKIVWSFANHNLEYGSKIVAKIQSIVAPAGSSLIIQRTFGTTSLFEKVKTLSSFKSGGFSVTVPGLPIGYFKYRILIEKSGRLLYTSPQNIFHSYGPIPFSTICGERTGGDGSCGPGTIQFGNSSVFSYVASDSTAQTAAPGDNEYTFNNLSCRTGTLEIAVGWPQATNTGLTATFQIAEAAADPQLITVQDTSTSQFQFKLNRGAVYLDEWYSGGTALDSNGNGYNDENAYFSGSFDCYTINGLIGK